MTIQIYGASDDLIEVEGDIREEFSAGDDGPHYLACSDGTVLSANYDREGFWRIVRLKEGTAAFEKKEATDVDEDYTDRVTLTGGVHWIVCGREMARAPR